MNEIWAALAGAITTAVLGTLLSYFNYRRTRKRLLDAAALCCLDRLRKIEAAAKTPVPSDDAGQAVADTLLPADDAEIDALPKERRKTVKNELSSPVGFRPALLVAEEPNRDTSQTARSCQIGLGEWTDPDSA